VRHSPWTKALAITTAISSALTSLFICSQLIDSGPDLITITTIPGPACNTSPLGGSFDHFFHDDIEKSFSLNFFVFILIKDQLLHQQTKAFVTKAQDRPSAIRDIGKLVICIVLYFPAKFAFNWNAYAVTILKVDTVVATTTTLNITVMHDLTPFRKGLNTFFLECQPKTDLQEAMAEL
jgi:hypothetical protein